MSGKIKWEVRIMAFVLVLSRCLGAGGEPSLSNSVWRISLEKDHSVQLSGPDLAALQFQPRFRVLLSWTDPKYELRFANLGDPKMARRYNVATWLTSPAPKGATNRGATNAHVADGFDPRLDQSAGLDRTDDAFRTGQSVEVVAERSEFKGDRITWSFERNAAFELEAWIGLPRKGGLPILEFTLIPKTNAWFSVVYTGAQEIDPSEATEIWQPLIWQEKRFPNQAYLTEAARCTLPMTLVETEDGTWGVAADPQELPFQPMPTPANSRFGVAVRNGGGRAQPTLFAPILGGVGSKRRPNEVFVFRMRLVASRDEIPDVYEQAARGLFQFRDYRRNDELGSLNRTIERTLDYAMSSWARFDEDLRGSAYETDVPGSVKNVSALHPLSIALITDEEQYFQHRAKPMLEYVLSREKFLFTTDPKVTGQGASAKMAGPCAPLSELTALYEMSGHRSGFLLDLARNLHGQPRTLNLDDVVPGDSWQNALALYRATGEARWLSLARSGADEYIRQRMRRPQADFDDPSSRGMFFWTSYAPNWMELFELFECTGEKRYLEAARAGARRFAQFTWMCPAIPDGSVTVNEGGLAPAYRKGANFPRIRIPEEDVPAWRVSEIGLACESSGTSKGHRGIFLATHAPWMLRLGWRAEDSFLRDIARSAVIGRYTSFPGYHMNTARTTVYEKPDFAKRPTRAINSTSSLHYNHIWPHLSMLMDYLVADAENRSRGAISFPSHFAEGYAYLQLKVYGDRAGKLYDRENLWLWMPAGLLTFDNPEINYIAARGKGALYLVLMNQCQAMITAKCAIDAKRAGTEASRTHEARVWEDNELKGDRSITPGGFEVTLKPGGLVALEVKGLKPEVKLQNKVAAIARPWKRDRALLASPEATGMIFNYGQDLTWAYVYLHAREEIKQAVLEYSVNGSTWHQAKDANFPFEFSIPLAAEAHQFTFRIRALRFSGETISSEEAALAK